jgi:hypothetical protein
MTRNVAKAQATAITTTIGPIHGLNDRFCRGGVVPPSLVSPETDIGLYKPGRERRQ